MAMHGAPGGPTSSALYDAATDAFRRWRDGDEAALDELVRVMSPVLWHVVRATGLDKEAAEDVVQNTWLTLVRSADSVRDAQAITRWLCTAARREAWRVSKAVGPHPSGRGRGARRADAGPDLARVRGRDQRRERARLWQALGRLPERCQKLLRIVAWEPRPDYSSVADTPRDADRQHRPDAPPLPRQAPASSSEVRHDAPPTRSCSTAIAVLYADLDPAPDGPRRRRAGPAGGRGPRDRVRAAHPGRARRHTPPAPVARPSPRPGDDRRSRSSSPVRRTACWCASAAPTTAHRRLDGWVVPGACRCGSSSGRRATRSPTPGRAPYADRDGRFEFPAPMTGEVRLWLLPQSGRDEDSGASVRHPAVPGLRRHRCPRRVAAAGDFLAGVVSAARPSAPEGQGRTRWIGGPAHPAPQGRAPLLGAGPGCGAPGGCSATRLFRVCHRPPAWPRPRQVARLVHEALHVRRPPAVVPLLQLGIRQSVPSTICRQR